MATTLFLQYLSSVVSLGLGCGTCCSPFFSVFLSAYTATHARNVARALKIFLQFFLGKLTAIILLCVLTSLIGRQWINEEGYIGNINLHYIAEIGLLLLGSVLICNWVYRQRKSSKCKNCGQTCKAREDDREGKIWEEKRSQWPTYVAGFIYGITPCPPILLLIGYALMLSAGKSIILALVFTVVSSVSPMLLMVLTAGIMSVKMYKEIPKLITWIRLFCYILFVIIAIIMLITD